jgi:hypothetical protein
LGLLDPTFSPGVAIEIKTPPIGPTNPELNAEYEQDLERNFDLHVEEIGNVALSHPTNLLPTSAETLQFILPIRTFAASFNSRVGRSSSKNHSQCPPRCS